MNKKISIIIPCFNVANYLDRSYASLKNQTIGIDEIECIFVNDGSTDGGKTIEKLKEIERDNPDSVIVVDLPENVGQGEARNIGLTYANSEYIQFFDADDELRKDACEVLYNILKKTDADIIQFNHMYVYENRQKSSMDSTENKLYELKDIDEITDIKDMQLRFRFLDTSIVTYGCTNKIYKKELIEKVNVRFPAKLKYEEPLFVYPLFVYAKKVYLLNDELYFYHIRFGSTITSEIGKKILDHPKVQFMLLDFLLKLPEYENCKVVFEIYFLWSFYYETISFASMHNDAYIPLEFFKYMQEICWKFFPDWEKNPYVNALEKQIRDILDTLKYSFNSQEELNAYIANLKY